RVALCVSPTDSRHIARAYVGITRRIKILADKALLSAYSEGSHAITERHVKAAIADSEFAAAPARRGLRPAALVAVAAALGVAVGAGVQWLLSTPQAPLVPVQAAPPKPAPVAAPAAE